MRTFVAEDIYGRIVEICAYTETVARQKAGKVLGHGKVIRFSETLVM